MRNFLQNIVRRDDASLLPRQRFVEVCTQGLSLTCFLAVLLSSTVASATPEMSVSPSAVDFGEVLVGAPNSVNVTITNTGGVDLELTGISIAPPENDFDIPLLSSGLPPAFPVTIAPGNAVSFNVTYTPSELGVDEDKVKISTNDPLNPVVEVPLDGEGVAPISPEIGVSSTSISFAAVFIGSGKSRLLTVTNQGTGDLAISSLALTGTGRSQYILSGAPSDFPHLLQPNASLILAVIYRPNQARTHYADLVGITTSSSRASPARPLRRRPNKWLGR